MAGSWKRVTHATKEGLGIITRIIFGLIIMTPLMIVLYLLCWIRVKITALVYCNESRSLLSSRDLLPMLDFDKVNSIVNVIILTKSIFPLDAMKELFLSKVLNAKDTNNSPQFPKLTRYIKLCAGYLMWIEETNFNVDDHIRPYSGQPPNNEEQLKTLITDLCNKPFPTLKSSWEIIVIPVQYSDVQQTCILFRMHHFMADGIAIFRLIIEQMAGDHGAIQQILKQMQSKFKPQFNNAFLNILGNIGRIIYDCICNKSKLSISQVNQVFMKEKSECGELSESAYSDWTSAIKLDTIKRIKEVTSTTVNDVLVSCMAGAFWKYFVRQDICPPDFCTALIPVTYQGPNDPVEPSNKFSSIWMSMPTGDMDCLQRLKATKIEMDHFKSSPDQVSHRWFQQYWPNVIPYTMMSQVFKCLNFNLIFSNMPGPTTKAAVNGNTIESLVLSLFPSFRSGFGVFIFTYAGDVTVSVSVDKARVGSRDVLRQLLDDLVEEVQQLYNAVIL